jgi:hypothetical protein
MDELKIKLLSPILKALVTKLIKEAIFKKLGCRTDIDIELSDLHFTVDSGRAKIHISADAEMGSNELFDIIKTIAFN